jgi:hypothetical protein
MFATGSHDGAVRIWTKRPDDQYEEELTDHEPGIVGSHIPRTNSPFELLEHERRSDSPPTQQDYFNTVHSSIEGAHPLLRDQIGAFAFWRDTT